MLTSDNSTKRAGRSGFFGEGQGLTIGGCGEGVLAALIVCVRGAAQSGYPGSGLRGHVLDSWVRGPLAMTGSISSASSSEATRNVSLCW